jgi:hypothetical protein
VADEFGERLYFPGEKGGEKAPEFEIEEQGFRN